MAQRLRALLLFPATTKWLTAIPDDIWCPLLVCVYIVIIKQTTNKQNCGEAGLVAKPMPPYHA